MFWLANSAKFEFSILNVNSWSTFKSKMFIARFWHVFSEFDNQIKKQDSPVAALAKYRVMASIFPPFLIKKCPPNVIFTDHTGWWFSNLDDSFHAQDLTDCCKGYENSVLLIEKTLKEQVFYIKLQNLLEFISFLMEYQYLILISFVQCFYPALFQQLFMASSACIK